ncbi:MAG: dihydropteroate synthase [Verrucomicrobia bacterium]|nr:dihydropteroate synthase [Verrucomicrobiota bacterium]NDF17161.1 dihydropteroate synthase [Verrucomicrobiota bacterium]
MLSLETLAALARDHAEDLSCRVAEFTLRGVPFRSVDRPHLMGVVNFSAESWYRESVVLSTAAAIERARRLKAEGAHLIDLGAESTLDHAARVDPDSQSRMLVPVIRALSPEGFLFSAETYQPATARACLEAGAAVLNLTGARASGEIYRMVADHNAGIILCYVQGPHVREAGDFVRSADHAATLRDHFQKEIERALAAGVQAIWIDPGLGFYYRNLRDSADRIRYQAETFLHTFRLRSLGWPVCHALPHAFEFFQEEVRTAESLFAVLAILGKTDLLRTHEVSKVRAVVRTLGVLP